MYNVIVCNYIISTCNGGKSMKRNITKRVFALLLSAVLCAAACVTAFADSKTYTVTECDNLQITLPDNMTAITRSSDAKDGYFALHSLDYNKVMSDFRSGDIYLQAMDNVETITLSLSSLETEESQRLGNYNQLTAGDLDQIARNFVNTPGSVSYNSATLDEAGKDVVWLYFNMTGKDQSGNSFRQYQANTVYDGKSISLTLNRNGGDVAVEDYAILSGIVSTVKFQDKNKPFLSDMMLYIIIGGAVLLIILLIIMIALVKKSKKRKKKSQNDKIIQELAGKYQTRQGGARDDAYDEPYDEAYDVSGVPTEETAVDEADVQDGGFEEEMPSQDYDLDAFDDGVERKYSDADIARLLGDVEDDENFNEALPVMPADSEEDEEVRDSVIEEAGEISEFFEDLPEESEEPGEKDETEAFEEEQLTVVEENSPAAEETDETEESEESEEFEESDDFDESVDSGSEFDDSDEADEEFEEYASDEVLVREESNQDKFRDSSDFFEEAPKRMMGVISSKEIEEAEEYDVIGEEEQRAEAIEKEPVKKGEGFSNAMKKVGAGLKSFGVHCGYFATNVKRAIKRKSAKNKRKKAEEERRRRQMERRAQERAARERAPRRDENGLVQVHRRDDRRPNNRR